MSQETVNIISQSWKGHCVVFGEEIKTLNFNICNINAYKLRDIIFYRDSINKMFSDENKLPEHCLKLERWQGPPDINKVKQYEMDLSFMVSLSIKFVCH